MKEWGRGLYYFLEGLSQGRCSYLSWEYYDDQTFEFLVRREQS